MLPKFKLEEYFEKYEFVAPFTMGSSDSETHTLSELLSMADKECLVLWNNLKLSYTQIHGLPFLREEIRKLYDTQRKDNILVFSGAEEAIYITMQVLLKRDDNVIVLTPCYQSLKEIPKSLGANVTEFPLEWKNNNWFFDLDKFSDLVTDKTKLVIVNFPHNPTGFQPSKEIYKSIIDIVKRCNVYLFNDEVYRLSEQSPEDCLPNAADCYERAISLGVMSKSFGLPGLRIGWIATHNTSLLQDFASYKNYTTICNSAPSEILSLIALRNRAHILDRNRKITKHNLDLLDDFFNRYSSIYEWDRPIAGFVSFPRLKLDINIETYAEKLINEEGVIIIPGSLFEASNNRFRLGFGRRNLPQALVKFEYFTKKYIY